MQKIKIKIKIMLLFVLCLMSLLSLGQVLSTEADRTVFETYKKQFENKKDLPMGDLLVETGKFFLGKPYVAATLEGAGPEQVTVNLRELDCTTLVESCVALAQTLKSDQINFDRFCHYLESVRYRNGQCVGYPSRLHYFSDWIYDNTQRKHRVGDPAFTDVSKLAGGSPLVLRINYMSSHPRQYQQLSDAEMMEQIKVQEDVINQRSYYYIPKGKLAGLEKNIHDGDIFAITTSVKGLDIAHVGLAYWQNGQLYFIHASLKAKKVIVNPETLQVYLNQAASRTGIMLVRITD